MNKKLIPALFILLLITACPNNKKNKYGIVLASTNLKEVPPIGSIVTINKEDLKQQITNINFNGNNFNLNSFNIEKFNIKEEAEKFLKNFQPYVNTYILSQKDILPLRTNPNHYADNIIYRIPKNSILKVISIGEDTKAGALNGKWIYALTKNGYKGYVFDYELDIFDDVPGKIIPIPMDIESQQNTINFFQTHTYLRPLYFEKILLNKTNNLELLKEEYGLFFSKKNTINLNVPEKNVHFQFSTIAEVKPNGYLFRKDHTNKDFLLIKTLNKRYFDVSLKINNEMFLYSFVLIGQNINIIIQNIKMQNQQLIDKITSYENLESKEYGRIKFNKNLTFAWEKSKNLKYLPSLGTYEIIGIMSDLQKSYKAALKFSEGKNFFYFLLDYTNKALQLILVNKQNMKENAILNDKNKLAIILFEDNFNPNVSFGK